MKNKPEQEAVCTYCGAKLNPGEWYFGMEGKTPEGDHISVNVCKDCFCDIAKKEIKDGQSN